MSQTDNQPSLVSRSLGLQIMDRYVAREFLVSYVIALLVVLGLRIILDLFIEFDEFIEPKDGQAAPGAWQVIRYILDYYAPKTLEFFRDFSGVIILLAAMFSLVRLTRQNELTAVIASGISLKRIIAPVVLLGVLLNLLMVADQELILPRFADKLVRRHDEMAALRQLSVWLQPDRDGALLSGRLDPRQMSLTDVWILLRQDGQAAAWIKADRADWDAERRQYRLENGYLYELATGQNTQRDLRRPLETYPAQKASSLPPDYLWLQRYANFKNLMSSAELSSLLRRQIKPAERAEAISEKHFRFTDPIINIVMLLLGLPLIVSRERKSTKTTVLLVMLGSGGCFIGTFVCKLLAGAPLDPLLAAWLPIILFLPLSILALDAIKT
ncbi:MAG: LptF/LptG family permease [Sedimentisphaerales bacterium]|nr:LptF/LptG family permease [Sedimentisphaerales bacterium]